MTMEKDRILLVEDEDRDRQLITTALEREGYEVLGAPSGEEGLAAQRSSA